jgi:hypothetical protein
MDTGTYCRERLYCMYSMYVQLWWMSRYSFLLRQRLGYLLYRTGETRQRLGYLPYRTGRVETKKRLLIFAKRCNFLRNFTKFYFARMAAYFRVNVIYVPGVYLRENYCKFLQKFWWKWYPILSRTGKCTEVFANFFAKYVDISFLTNFAKICTGR